MAGMPPIMLSIAGSDPSGGAGVQADLKTATALGAYGAAVITSLTVQNTRGVTGIHQVPAGFVADQARAVLDDLDVGAIKIGMLATPEIAEAVGSVLAEHPGIPVVLDPVMVATSGDRLVTAETTAVIIEKLLPAATLVTPNLGETGTLLVAEPPQSPDEMVTAAIRLRERGCPAALIKGGHLDGQREVLVDVLADAGGIELIEGPLIDTANTHGTGCTLSSAIASRLASGDQLRDAIRAARTYLTGALRSGADLEIGRGHGPVDHLWERHEEQR
ncbi:hydroxymethylpyrimidine/phosphomethylpyrimidine kinase [Microlunatus endophyticus]|uniref:Hydroxymethylpyrimidine/phosphomethylpyrimidine kinase n=1 Tax=Microlunatus endophyticus TaxID=1716077 RepID=A0A917W5Y2_9ACTN|nr:bifunctional hydroxymethylpyrimidine kinase/phosphomethylpyrimidine kinase [Microlunatus endophyticus]GGL67462.1 hydroxymethylpyrimidine/phosphomethylpyrimidine kinase [Microlunatus endophyticus]